MNLTRFLVALGLAVAFAVTPITALSSSAALAKEADKQQPAEADKTTKEKVKDAAETAKEKAADAAERAKEIAADAKEKIQAKLAELNKPGEEVAVFKLNGPITEKPGADDPFFGTAGSESLQQLVERMNKAATDPEVKGVVFIMDGGESMGWAQVEELRAAMKRVRDAGKPIYAHVDYLTTGRLALLAGASRISVVPTGHVIINGIHGESPYLRGLLNMIGVTPDFIAMGEYKSAGEMFTNTAPSPAAEKMTTWLFDSLYESYIKQIAEGRGVTADKARQWIDGAIYTAEGAKAAGIIDAVEHRDDFVASLKKEHGDAVAFNTRYGRPKAMGIDLSSPAGLMRFYMDLLSGPKVMVSNKDSIAVVYIEGTIMPGEQQSSPFGGATAGAFSTTLRKTLSQVASDDSIKAVVLRIDSPGGSAVASEIILDATKRVAEKKPLVVSMGNVAGSGGYYVACAAQTIFADRATLTGSIGVISGKFATTDMWGRIGVNWKAHDRGKNADMMSSAAPFTDEQRALMTKWMDETYGVFKRHVTDIRGDRLKKPIDQLAGGRVYTGAQALELGLVDRIGTLDDAIAFAAEKANIHDYEIRVLPRTKGFLEMLMGGAGDAHMTTGLDAPNAAQLVAPARNVSPLLNAALPHLRDLEPQRVDAVMQALEQLSLFQNERVNLTMPIYVLPR
ncbi:MAG: signal peptide peptidase SppA [Phycisphaera sp.]|nr:signal peptide peptidase SppA [Phycisphaera sp.]